MYLGSSIYRIHGTNDPSTIGKFVSSGCIRLTNEDVADLFSRVTVGTKVVVLPKNAPHMATRNPDDKDDDHRSPGSPASAPCRNDGHAGPPGDEPFDVVAVLSRETRMNWISGKRLALGAAAVLCASALAPAAQAEDFFSALFGGFGRSRAPQIHLPFAGEGGCSRRASRVSAVTAAARPIACAPATGAISR